MTTAAGRLTVTWRCSLLTAAWLAGPRPGLGYNRSRGADETVHIPDSRRIPSDDAMSGRHAWGMTRIALLSVTMVAARTHVAGVARVSGASQVTKYPYQETRL